MEESDELTKNNSSDDVVKQKTASAADTKSPMANSEAEEDAARNNISNSQRSREEGELSSYDDDDNRAMSYSPQVTSGNATPQEPVQSIPASRSTHDVKAGKSASLNNFVGDVPSRDTVQSNHQKSCEKNRGPFVPFVISFSDDDSGSDSEHSRHKNNILTNSRNLGPDRSKRPPVTSLPKSQKVKETRSDAKVLPRKVSLSRSFISSMTQIRGSTSRGNGPYPSSRTSNDLKKVMDQDHGRKINFHLNTSKLQDLRQLIAIRENELKRKSAQLTKSSGSAPHRDYCFANSSSEEARGRRAVSVDNVECEAKEPEEKRRKISELKPSQPLAAGHREVPVRQSGLASEKFALGNFDQHKTQDLRKEMHLHASHSRFSGSEKEGARGVLVSSANLPVGVKEGTNVANTSRQIDRNSKRANPAFPSEQGAQEANHATKNVTREKRIVDVKHPAKQSSQFHSSSFQNNTTSESYFTERSDRHEIRSDGKAIEPASNDTYQGCFPHHLASNLRTNDTSLNNPSFWNGMCTGTSDMDLQALLDLEQSHDKELEEAQEHRRKCEVEERNARDAYLRAQRALAEANARCSYLYRKREMYSTQLRSLMMENSNLFWSFGPNDQIGLQLNPANNISDINVHLIPTSNGQVQAENDACSHRALDQDVHSADDIHQNIQDLRVAVQNVASDPASEPDYSISEPNKEDGATKGVYHPHDDSTVSGDEDGETFHASENGLEYERRDESSGDTEKEINDGLERQEQLDSSQDSLLLEASLRAQLFERLQMNSLTKKMGPGRADGGIGHDGGGKVECDPIKCPPAEGHEEDKHSDLSGMRQEEFTNKTDIVGQTGLEPSSVVSLSCPVLRSAYLNLKITDPTVLAQSQIKSPEMQLACVDDENKDRHLPVENKQVNSSLSSNEATLLGLNVGQIGSYSSSPAIDPFWPLCMYELRGKCNNDECPWQHSRNYSCNDCQVVSSERNFDNATTLTKSIDCLVLYTPTYLVDLDVLQANVGPYKSILARGYGHCWRKCFSAALVLSSLLPTEFYQSEPFLHGSERRIEANASRTRQLLDFHRTRVLKQAERHPADGDQALEMALLNLSNEANKEKGRVEALKVLAPTVESHPTSAVLWIVYLQIYYSNQKSIGKDDMFRCAVEYNENSYELWLLYINSRTLLDDRLVAYDAALSALCRYASGPNRNNIHESPCILDIFLQMINCLCMSGNVYKALEKIDGLSPSPKRSDKLNELFLPNVITCLTIYDKCVFWICCVYLTIYRKLPDAIVQQFEFRKELYAIEWPDTQLTIEVRQQANLLIGSAVDSLALHIDAVSLENEETLRSAHLFAVNHVRCMAVLEGFDCSRSLLENYTRLYPSCLELVLMSAWTEYELGTEKFAGFEKALSIWLEDIPGIQCLWNQYAASALQNGSFDFARELMDRWFSSVWKVQCSGSETVDNIDYESFWSSPQPSSASNPLAWRSIYIQTDVVFGLLNFSLHKILHNDHTEACLAVDRALKAATAENYTHAAREHALFSLASCSPHERDGPIENTMKILGSYVVDARASYGSEPLSRDYIQKIEKQSVQHLASKLLNPLSDFSLVNSVLEVLYGPSLLPQTYHKLSDMVEFVEALMGIRPSNYKLAISVCKLLTQSSKTVKVPANVSFWASSLLVNALFQAVPVAPESMWLEAADILHNLTDLHAVSETFHKRALEVYPFSISMWKSYLSLFSDTSSTGSVKEAAREKGIRLD